MPVSIVEIAWQMLGMPQKVVVIGKPVNVGVMHVNILKEVKNLRNQLLQQLDCIQIEIYDISPAVGVHAGSGTIGLGLYTLENK